MAELLGTGVVQADVVCGPAGAEGVAAGGELAGQVGKGAVVRVAVRLSAVGVELRALGSRQQ